MTTEEKLPPWHNAIQAYRNAKPQNADALDEAFEKFDPDEDSAADGLPSQENANGEGLPTDTAAEQLGMEAMMGNTKPIYWEDFFTRSEVEATKKVRRGQQALGPLTREWIAEQCGGTIGDGGRSRKQFLNTRRGKFALTLSEDNLNSTELASITSMGATHVAVEDVAGICRFFEDHGLPGAETYERLREYLRGRMWSI